MFLLLAPGGIGPAAGAAAIPGIAPNVIAQLRSKDNPADNPANHPIYQQISDLTSMANQEAELLIQALVIAGGVSIKEKAVLAKTDAAVASQIESLVTPGYRGASAISSTDSVKFDPKKGKFEYRGKSKVEASAEAILKSPEFKAFKNDPKFKENVTSIESMLKSYKSLGALVTSYYTATNQKKRDAALSALNKIIKNDLSGIKPKSKKEPLGDLPRAYLSAPLVVIKAIQDKAGVPLDSGAITKLAEQEALAGGKIGEVAKGLVQKAEQEITASNQPQQNPAHGQMAA